MNGPNAPLCVRGGLARERSRSHHERRQQRGRAGAAHATRLAATRRSSSCFERCPRDSAAIVSLVRRQQRFGLSTLLVRGAATSVAAALDRGERVRRPGPGPCRRALERLFLFAERSLVVGAGFRAPGPGLGAHRAGLAAGPGLSLHPGLDARRRVSAQKERERERESRGRGE